MGDAGDREYGTLAPALSQRAKGDGFLGNLDNICQGTRPQRLRFGGKWRGRF